MTTRAYLSDHQTISNAELRQLLGLGESPSARVAASRLLSRWRDEGGFLEELPPRNRPRYRLRAKPQPVATQPA